MFEWLYNFFMMIMSYITNFFGIKSNVPDNQPVESAPQNEVISS